MNGRLTHQCSFQAYPDFQIMDYFVIRTLQSVFQSDASATVRPMTYYVESPSAISGLFSNIAYAKCKSISEGNITLSPAKC